MVRVLALGLICASLVAGEGSLRATARDGPSALQFSTVVFNSTGAVKVRKGKMSKECERGLKEADYRVQLLAGSGSAWYNSFKKSCKGTEFEVLVSQTYDLGKSRPGCPKLANSVKFAPTLLPGISRIPNKQYKAYIEGVNCLDNKGVSGVYMKTDSNDMCSKKLAKTSTLGSIIFSGIPARVTVTTKKTWKYQPFVIDVTGCTIELSEFELTGHETMNLKGASSIIRVGATAAVLAVAAMII